MLPPDFAARYTEAVIRYSADADEEPEAGTAECDHCGSDVPNDDLTAATGRVQRRGHFYPDTDQHVCPSCIDDDFTECDDCSTPTHNDLITDSARTSSRRSWTYPVCQSCRDDSYHECPNCDRWTHEEHMTGEDSGGQTICRSCNEDYFTCDNCDGRFHNNDSGEDGNCNDCAEEDEEQDSDHIHPYSYRPDWKPLGNPNERHFGVELETVLNHGDLHDAASEVLDKLNDSLPDEGFAFLKADSSLSGGVGSFEIVTHPATLAVHKERWVDVLGSNAPDGLVSHDAACCGMHVHVEKKGLSVGDVGKLLHFVNAINNRPFIAAVARRTDEGFAKLDDRKTATAAMKVPSSRREAINLTNNKTIEFRIFKGTLKPESFFRSLEFCDALVRFAKVSSLRDMVSDHSGKMGGVYSFGDFVEGERKRYPNLYPFVQQFLGREVKQPKPRPEKLARRDAFQVRMSVRLQFDPSLSS